MPKLARLAAIALASIALASAACLAVACGRQPAPPAAGAPVDPAPAAAGAPSSGPGAPAPAATPAPPDELCDATECGPAMRMPTRRCPDGSMGGPTGRCLRRSDGKCAWEVRPCPPP